MMSLVSIHAPREGCDSLVISDKNLLMQFQFTHPGRGATVAKMTLTEVQREFQFTHPGRGATI